MFTEYQHIFIIFILVWLIIQTVFTIYLYYTWRKIFSGTAGKNLKKVLEKSLEKSGEIKVKFDDIEKTIESLNEEKVEYYQKSAFLRFNPFGDTGGDQSFVWALLDKNDNGVILSSLHGREGTRVYAKEIRNGSVVNHRLSDEENKVLNRAKLDK